MKIILLTISAILFVSCTPLYAATSHTFGWDYSTADQANITQFRLYRDGEHQTSVTIQPSARTVTVDAATDRLKHTYFLTAYGSGGESGQSEQAVTYPTPLAPTSLVRAATSPTGNDIFTWVYPAAEEPNITGFQIYRDGVALLPLIAGPSIRTITLDKPADTKSHVYEIVAYNEAMNESGPKSVAFTVLAKPVPPVKFWRQITTVPVR